MQLTRSLAAGLAIVAALAVTVVVPTAAPAGTLHPAVQDELSRLLPGQEATVLVVFEEQAPIATMNLALRSQRATRQERHRQVVEELQAVAHRAQEPVLRDLEAMRLRGEVSGYTPYWIANLIVVRGTRSAIEQLGARSEIAIVEPNVKAELIGPVGGIPPLHGATSTRGIGVSPGVRACRAPEVWYQLGINGTGALVANMDTGVDGTHPALQTRWRGYQGAHPWQECWKDVLGGNTQAPVDNYGHGTHVMGTITGLGAATQDTVGLAWGAQWIACNPINQGVGPEFDNDVISCFQWLADPDGNPNTVTDVPDVVQSSWRINEGFGYDYTDCDTRWWAAIDGCEAAGVCLTFSAGNEGSGASTIGSPADRATTMYNTFSVGAVDATNYGWPYPIAGFSSRGPTGCNVVPALKIKPEICAPGVHVYSSIPGGGYDGTWDGTSMAGPHVAGVVGLMRSANPDIDVESIKQIIMDTARDEGAAGEDNTYGFGMIDGYEAVVRCLQGYGTLAGQVGNASNGGSPVAGAQVRLVEVGRSFYSDGTGHYSGMGAAGTYTVQVSHPSFTTVTVSGVSLTAGETTTRDFSLVDVGAPSITEVNFPQAVQSPGSPIPVTALITDYSAIQSAQIHWRVNGGDFSVVAMNLNGSGRWEGGIPGQAIGSNVEFYLTASDIVGNNAIEPAGAPAELHQILVVLSFFAEDGEAGAPGWSLSQPSDALAGRWVLVSPYGTVSNGQQIEPSADHTPAPGTHCFVTGAATAPGQPAALSDVDWGCVTLTSPTINLSGALEAILSYWRWFIGTDGLGSSFTVKLSNDDGATWTNLEYFFQPALNQWNQATFDLANIMPLTAQMKVRVVACDSGEDSVVEGAFDDMLVQGIPSATSAVASDATAAGPVLYTNRPNPFSGRTELGFRLPASASAELSIYDPAGRRVRTLLAGPFGAGEHRAVWDGKDDAGHTVGTGVYFYSLRTNGFEEQRKMLLVK